MDGKMEGWTDEWTDRTDKHYIPFWHTSYAGDIISWKPTDLDLHCKGRAYPGSAGPWFKCSHSYVKKNPWSPVAYDNSSSGILVPLEI